MRIDAYNKVSQLYQANSTKQTAKTGTVSKKDKFEISQTGKDYQIARQALSSVPDVRMERVEAIKKQMQSGNYNISAEEAADKIVEDYFNTTI